MTRVSGFRLLVTGAVVGLAVALASGSLGHAATGDTAAIKQVITRYERALNGADAARVMGLYTDDAVLMPANRPAVLGKDTVRSSYEAIFTKLGFDLSFRVDEVVVAGSWAFARTTSTGTITLKASGTALAEDNSEVFILRHEGGAWKIARYIFNSNRPPPA